MFKSILMCTLMAVAICQENNGTTGNTTLAPLTTASPITSTEGPNTTTATTTTSKPTTPKPNPPPTPKSTFTVKNETTGVVCIIFEVQGTFNFTYKGSNDKNLTVVHDFPASNGTAVTHSGVCGETDQFLQIKFNNGWEFVVNFNLSRTKTQFQTNALILNYVYTKEKFPNIDPSLENKTESVNYTGSFFRSPINTSYKCNKQPATTLGNNVIWSTTFLRSEAFRTSNSTQFSDARECDADLVVNNIVPIAVGAALAGLVLIVLIAYLIGRKRSRRGYESV